ncbi:MAG: PspA/IM30 family protein [Frankiaceae bacterium]|jgi:phage shock protein A
MANFFRRLFRYGSAYANTKFDEKADPRIQIEQAIQEAQRQHQLLTQQAAAVLGNRRQLEMKLARQLDEVERLQASARQSLVLADQARAAGDLQKSAQYEQTAQAFATQLVSTERSVEDLKVLHDQALQSSEAAKKAVEQNAYQMQQQLAERSKLLTQLEHAKMQEQMSKSLEQMSSIAPPGDTPSLGEVRDKIEKRYAVAMGRQELASGSVEGRMLEVQRATINTEAISRLDDIRASMGGAPAAPQLQGGATPAIEGTPAAPDTATTGPSFTKQARPGRSGSS